MKTLSALVISTGPRVVTIQMKASPGVQDFLQRVAAGTIAIDSFVATAAGEETTLMRAVRGRMAEDVRVLLDNNASPNLEDGGGETAVSLAVRAAKPGDAAAMDVLGVFMLPGLPFPPDWKKRYSGGKTLLHIAVETRNQEAIRWLRDAGVPADALDDYDVSAADLSMRFFNKNLLA